MTAYRAILFDKDGTLIDFAASWTAAYLGLSHDLADAAGDPTAWRLLLARQGYDAGNDRFAPDSPLLWATNAAIAAAFAAMPELAGIDCEKIVEAHLSDLERYPPVPVGDLVALFGRLRARGLNLGIATMDHRAQALATANLLGIGQLLDFVVGCDCGHGEKPGPGMVLAFAAAIGIPPAEIVVVGDTRADLLMARAAGAGLAVAVLTGGSPAASLAPLADHVLERATDIEQVLG